MIFSINIPSGSSVEFSEEGVKFLLGLFFKYDEDKDGNLSQTELTSLFSVCPTMSWSVEQLSSVETTSLGWVTKRGYMALWTMNAFLNVTLTMEQLAYLGFNIAFRSQLAALKITRDRRIDIQEKSTTRKVFQCHVIGAKDAGKTVFCRSFVGKSLLEIQRMNKKQMTPYVINTVTVKGSEKYLLVSISMKYLNNFIFSFKKLIFILLPIHLALTKLLLMLFVCYMMEPQQIPLVIALKFIWYD